MFFEITFNFFSSKQNSIFTFQVIFFLLLSLDLSTKLFSFLFLSWRGKKLWWHQKNSSTMIWDWIRDCYYAINSWQENSLFSHTKKRRKYWGEWQKNEYFFSPHLMCIFPFQQEWETCRQTDSLRLLNNFIVMSSNLEYHFRHYKLETAPSIFFPSFFSPLRLSHPRCLPSCCCGCEIFFLRVRNKRERK